MQLAIVRREIAGPRECPGGTASGDFVMVSLFTGIWRGCCDSLCPVRRSGSTMRNVAGLRIPEFHEVIFDEPAYSVFATPYSFETSANRRERRSRSGRTSGYLTNRSGSSPRGFRKTSQRINLYEQRLIPDCREAMRKIRSIFRTSRPPPWAWPKWPRPSARRPRIKRLIDYFLSGKAGDVILSRKKKENSLGTG